MGDVNEPAPTRYRADGWPCCPRCDEDELASFAVPADAGGELRCYRCNWRGRVEPEPTAQLVARLRARLSKMSQVGHWRPGTVEKDTVYIPDANGLAGPALGERVILRVNRHFPFDDDVAGLVDLVNNAGELLRRIEALALELAQARAEGFAAGWCGHSDMGTTGLDYPTARAAYLAKL